MSSEFRTIFRPVGDTLIKTAIPVWWRLGPGDIAAGPDGLPDFGIAAPEPKTAPPRPTDFPKGEGKAKDVKGRGKGGEAAPALTPFEAEMRRAEIMGAIVAHHRPTLAARLAADHSIPVADAIRHLANAPTETALPDYSVEVTDAPAASFAPAFEANQLSHDERVEQFKKFAQATLDDQEARRVRT